MIYLLLSNNIINYLYHDEVTMLYHMCVYLMDEESKHSLLINNSNKSYLVRAVYITQLPASISFITSFTNKYKTCR